MIVVAIIICDRKSNDIDSISRIFELTHTDFRLYINIQSGNKEKWEVKINQIKSKFNRPDIILDYDIWNVSSTWLKEPQYDQDNNWRIDPITIARNMSINYARRNHSSHLLFVDADVVIPKDSVERLLSHNLPLVGGLVPIRDLNEESYYAFELIKKEENSYIISQLSKTQIFNEKLLKVFFGTMGFLMIGRNLFKHLSVRYDMEAAMVDDPAFAFDAKTFFKTDWHIDTSLLAEHSSSN